MGVFGTEKRDLLQFHEFPELLIRALLATEDVRFYQHYGVDFRGLVRAAVETARGRKQGASTITMQVARNFFLSRERHVIRKVYEILIALQIERNFSKERILELYLNQIFLGQGSFGFASAAKVYYGKTLEELTPAEIAVLVGLPQAPSRYNPLLNPALAKERQRHVLTRMYRNNIIDDETYETLFNAQLPQPQTTRVESANTGSDYASEEVRKLIYAHFGESAYERNLHIHTTIDSTLQRHALAALRKGLIDHEKRRGYAGPEKIIDIDELTSAQLVELARAEKIIGALLPAIVLRADKESVEVIAADGERYTIRGKGLAHVKRHLPGAKKTLINKGALIRLHRNDDIDDWEIVALPKAQAAIVAISPEDGAIRALIGGFDFQENKFNHAYQARRQPGSAIKPFIYSAALEKGFMPGNVIYDTPVYLSAEETGSDKPWEPKNYDGKYAGPILIRDALKFSKNLATIRLLQLITPQYAQDFLSRFGFDKKDHPPYLTLSLGSGAASPLAIASGYAVFSNGGFFVTPYLIKTVVDDEGTIITRDIDYRYRYRVIDPRNAYIMTTMLQSVVREGTGRRLLQLKRGDLAGKTGTTNNNVDAWFAGYGGNLVVVAWIGYDQPRSLGKKETGSRAALPIWMEFMKHALADAPEVEYVQPRGIVSALVDKEDGGLLEYETPDSIDEYFYQEYLPFTAGGDSADADTDDLL